MATCPGAIGERRVCLEHREGYCLGSDPDMFFTVLALYSFRRREFFSFRRTRADIRRGFRLIPGV